MLHSLRMTTPGLIERLASLPTLSGIPPRVSRPAGGRQLLNLASRPIDPPPVTDVLPRGCLSLRAPRFQVPSVDRSASHG
jgi:hypothetical protein